MDDRAFFTAELILTNRTDPATPPSGSLTLFPQADGNLYLKNSNGDVYPVGSPPGSLSDISTDGSALASQVGVWTSATVMQGATGFTFESETGKLSVPNLIAIGQAPILQRGASQIELRNIGFIDPTTALAIKNGLELDFGDIAGSLPLSRVSVPGTPDGTKYLADNGTWKTVNVPQFPAGAIVPYAGFASPAGWLFAQGQALAVASNPGLFAVIGYAYGGGGATFNLPNLQRRVPVGAGGEFGATAVGGASTHTLTTSEMPSHAHTTQAHSHGISDPGHAHQSLSSSGIASPGDTDFSPDEFGKKDQYAPTTASGTGISVSPSTVAINANGGNAPHNNMPPYIVLNYIIKT